MPNAEFAYLPQPQAKFTRGSKASEKTVNEEPMARKLSLDSAYESEDDIAASKAESSDTRSSTSSTSKAMAKIRAKLSRDNSKQPSDKKSSSSSYKAQVRRDNLLTYEALAIARM